MRERLIGFKYFEKVDTAISKLLANVTLNLDVVEVPLRDSLNCICAEDVRAPFDIPSFNRSAVDGYAVKSSATTSATPHNPVYLKLLDVIEAGVDIRNLKPIGDDEAYLIFTGGLLPEGADAVVPLENAIREGDKVRVVKSVYPYANVSRAGEDFRKGDVIVAKGTKIMPWHIAAIASANITRVKVYRKVKVAIINTGSELRELGDDLGCGGTVNTTGLLIDAYLRLLNVEPVWIGVVPDDVNEIRDALIRALKTSDAVIITGGSSVGGKDLVPEAIESLEGSVRIFHGVSMRPGRTAGAYIIFGKPVFLFSGLPVACLISLEVFLKPFLNNLTGTLDIPKPEVEGVMTRRLANEVGFTSFYRVRVCYSDRGTYYVEPLRLTGSGILSTLIKGNGILVVPENVEGIESGEKVKVIVVNPIMRCDD
ncbi:MAG: molybdopterin molybdotransferase MoeA [Sulfolobales archaeon]|nr:molybdopterin molybdotransferase MoeA [Sulfolobales archaeon]